MFSIQQTNKGFDSGYILKNNITQEYAHIIPLCGGILNALHIQMPNGIYNVIDGYTNEADFKEKNSSSFKSNVLFPYPNRIRNGIYSFGEQLYTLPINFTAEDNAIHGLVYDKEFTVIETSANNKSASISMEYVYNESVTGFPFLFRLCITYTLTKQRLRIETRIQNNGTKQFPYGFGLHHYFKVSDSVAHTSLEVPTNYTLPVDSHMIPTGEKQEYTEFTESKLIDTTTFDTCFEVLKNKQNIIKLSDTNSGSNLQIAYSSKDFPYVQIYTPPHRKSIAIEPMTCAPNAFNNNMGLLMLQGGEENVCVCEIQYET